MFHFQCILMIQQRLKLEKPITYHPRAAAWLDEFGDVHDDETTAGTRISFYILQVIIYDSKTKTLTLVSMS